MTDNQNENSQKEIDELSGVETTGHDWDDGSLKELNNPAPRWWLWVFYISVIWSVGYWVVYPAWPMLNGATEGTKGWTSYKKLAAEQAEIFDRQKVYLDRFEGASFDQIMADEELYAFAVAGGNSAFKDNCATCHGTGAEGRKGYPNLNDDDWLWGGTIDDIYQTLRYGIRSGHDEERLSEMPAFGKDELLEDEEIQAVTSFVLSMSEEGHNEGHGDLAKGATVFEEQCAACHGEKGEGGRDFGAPRLNDAIWLYGDTYDDVYQMVYNSRAGVMPAWVNRLDDNTIRQLAVYVHQHLGGGEQDGTEEESMDEEEIMDEEAMAEEAVSEDAVVQDVEEEAPVVEEPPMPESSSPAEATEELENGNVPEQGSETLPETQEPEHDGEAEPAEPEAGAEEPAEPEAGAEEPAGK